MLRRIIQWFWRRADRLGHYRRLLLEARRRNAALCETVLASKSTAQNIAKLTEQLAEARQELAETKCLLARARSEADALERGILDALRGSPYHSDIREKLDRALGRNQ